MLIFALSGFINGIAAIIFGTLVYFRNRKGRINQIFGLMSISIMIWGFSYGIWQLSKDKETALFWARMLSFGATFIPILFFHWILTLLDLQKKKRKVLILGYLLTLVFVIFSFTSFYVKDIKPVLGFPWWPQPGILYNFYIILGYFGLTGYSFSLLLKTYKTVSGYKREQIKYVIIGALLGLGGGATNFLLWYGIPFPPYGTFLVPFYPLILGYAISRYRLMDIRVILTEFLVGVIAFVLLMETILSKTFYEVLFRISLFLVFCFFGYLLIKSVLNEIKRRAEIERLYGELKRLDKAKSEFISIASHQLRTPLTAIKGYISMLLEGSFGKLSGKTKEPMENVYKSNERLIKLVNDLLSVTRIEAGKIELEPQKLSLEDIITSVVEELKIEAKKKNIYLNWERPKKPLPKIFVDRDKIRQVILNVVDNAIRYTNKGGVTVGLKTLNEKVQIKVSDTGVGMTKDELSKMFESFSRGMAGTRLYTEGVGLGLYIARRFVEMHNGKIWGESKGKGKGSQFFIELPIVKLPPTEFKKFLKEF